MWVIADLVSHLRGLSPGNITGGSCGWAVGWSFETGRKWKYHIPADGRVLLKQTRSEEELEWGEMEAYLLTL